MPDTDAPAKALSYPSDRQFFGHPRGLATLFFTEMWERFSFYGMRALLILFMTDATATGGLGLSVETAGVVYGLFTAAAYMAALPGGWLADRILGQRLAVIFGGVFIAAGNFALFAPGAAAFYAGLALVVAGTGLLKPNVSAIVGQLYSREDQRRDAGFSVFYMGINLGAFLAPLACGWAAREFGWRTGFLLAGIGMSLGLLQYAAGTKYLGDAGKDPATPNDKAAKRQALIAGSVILLFIIGVAALAFRGVLSAKSIADAAGAVLVTLVLLLFGWLLGAAKWDAADRKRLVVVFCLFVAAAVFWSVFEQAGSSMNLFAQRNTDNDFFGFVIPAPWYQSINALFIIVLAPVFGALWLRLGKHEPSSPAKFAWALGLVGAGFLILAAGAALSQAGAKVSPVWLLVTYLFHTAGELSLSPVGLSAMTKLAPARVAGLMMGVWFLSLSVGNYIGGRVAALYESMPLPTLFGAVGLVAVLSGFLMSLFVRPMVRLMGGVR